MLKGKTAIVTGAAKGIGKAISLMLASLGANIVLNYRSESHSLDELIEEIKSLGVEVIKVQGDISKFSDAENLVKETVKRFNKVDILVNNAGITKDGLILRMKEEDFDSVIEVNLKGAFNLIRQVAPIMLKQKQGKIINISSVVGVSGNAGQANYAASKAGIIGMTKSVAKELGARGITVNAVAPGFIKTAMTDVLPDKVKEGLIGSIPLKRLGEPEDVAKVVAFLASDAGSYITGQVIHVDGGMVM